MKIAVIGGGWAGIAAAVELTASGKQVTLFEAGRVLGGRARSVTIDGRTLDNGQHILLGAYRDTLALMRQVGANPDQLLDRRPLQVADNTGFRLSLAKVPAPLNVAWGLLTSSAVNLPEKLKTALWMQGVKFRRFQLEQDCSVAEWLDAAGQTGQLRKHLWEPLCLAALNTPANRASAQVFANLLRDSLGSAHRADTDLLIPRVPLGELLPEPAQHWLLAHGTEIRCGHRVGRIETRADEVFIDGESFDALILATAPQHLGKLLANEMAADRPNFTYEPIATVYLQFTCKTTLSFPLRNFVGNQCQWVVDRGNGLLSCILSGHGDWENLSDEALAGQMENELALPGNAIWRRVIREKRATFSCQPGLQRLPCTTTHPRIFLAGDHTWAEYPATLEGAIRSGRRAGLLCRSGI